MEPIKETEVCYGSVRIRGWNWDWKTERNWETEKRLECERVRHCVPTYYFMVQDDWFQWLNNIYVESTEWKCAGDKTLCKYSTMPNLNEWQTRHGYRLISFTSDTELEDLSSSIGGCLCSGRASLFIFFFVSFIVFIFRLFVEWEMNKNFKNFYVVWNSNEIRNEMLLNWFFFPSINKNFPFFVFGFSFDCHLHATFWNWCDFCCLHFDEFCFSIRESVWFLELCLLMQWTTKPYRLFFFPKSPIRLIFSEFFLKFNLDYDSNLVHYWNFRVTVMNAFEILLTTFWMFCFCCCCCVNDD